MKKNFLPLLLLITTTFGVITSCGPSSNPTTSQQEIVTGVEIGGAGSVYVGETIKLVAQVNGTTNQQVVWSSNDTSIATIDNNGTLTGINPGTVEIIATSVKDTNFSASKTIIVSQRKAESLKIDLVNSEQVSVNGDDIYCLPIGQHFDFKVTSNNKNTAIPDYLLYEVIAPSEVSASQFLVTKNENDSTIASFIGFAPVNGVTLKVTGTYEDFSTAPLIASITFNLLDSEAQNRETFKSALQSAEEFESKNMKEAKITQSFNSNSSYYFNKKLKIVSCENQTYTHYEKNYFSNDGDKKDIYTIYNGLYSNTYTNENHFYSFKYDENEQIESVFFNESAKETENRYSFAGFENGESVHFGIVNRLNNLMYSYTSIEEGVLSFSDSYAFSASRFEIEKNDNDSLYKVVSSYEDDEINQKVNLSLSISYDSEGKIKNYFFSQVIYNEFNQVLNTYEENGELIYSTKLINTEYSKHINVDDYFLEDFNLQVCNEKTEFYDYSNTSKYGAEYTEITSEGIKKYTVFKNKTLVLKVQNNSSNEKSSTLIDRIEGKSSNPNIIDDPVLTGSDIFAINPHRDNHDNISLGEAKLTFTSSKGIVCEIIVEFVNTELKSVFTTSVPENNDFGEIFLNRESSYFFINTDPDEDIYTYYLDIVEGEQNGLELFRYDYDNPFSYPGFSYAIRGLKLGSYKFRIGIEGSSIKTEDTYSIIVIEPYSVEYLEEQLVKTEQSFIYSTGTFDAYLKFISNTEIELESHLLGMDPVRSTINYKFETGKIVLEKDQTLPKGMYFEHVQKGEIYFDKKLSNLTIFMSIYSGVDAETSNEDIKYFPFTFTKYVDKTNLPEYVNGNSYTSDVFVVGQGMISTKLEFTSTTGTLTLINNSNSVILKASFNYTYDKIATSMMLTEITYEVEHEKLYLDDEIYFNNGLSRLELKLLEKDSYNYNISYFTI